MIKAIIFDLGGVIINIDKLLKNWNKIFKIKDKEKFWREINYEMIPLCKGEINETQFWKNVANRFKVDYNKIPKNFLDKDFKKSITFNKELLRLVSILKRKYKIGVISNIIGSHSKINRSLGLYDHFHHLVLSFEVKMTKDSAEIFKLAAQRMNVKPKECIFIDDIGKFVSVAESAGMSAILFKDNKQLKSELERLLSTKL